MLKNMCLYSRVNIVRKRSIQTVSSIEQSSFSWPFYMSSLTLFCDLCDCVKVKQGQAAQYVLWDHWDHGMQGNVYFGNGN
jgi:hypothetical protein